jgi:hypothetical protein
MATTGKNLHGLLEGLERDEDGHLRMKQSESTTDSGITLLDVLIDTALTNPDDPLYPYKFNITKGIIENYIEYSKTKKEDKIKSIFEYYLNPDNITPDDVKLVNLLAKGVKQIDSENGNFLAQSFQKNPNILNNFLFNNVEEKGQSTTEEKGPSTTEEKGPSTTEEKGQSTKLVPFIKGGYKVQTGGRVGMFESLKSVFGLDDYWNEKIDYSYAYRTMYDTIKSLDAKITMLEEKLKQNNITHNFTDRQIRIIVNCSSRGQMVSTSSEKEKAVNRAYNFIIEREQNKPIGTDDELSTECYRFKREKITDTEYNINYDFFPYIDLEKVTGLTYAIAVMYNVLGGTLFNVSVTALWSPMFALSLAELAVKPALLAVDLTASTIAAIFQKCRDAKIVPTDTAPAGGSKKTRHRKKNTKKNKKRKQRNTNRK